MHSHLSARSVSALLAFLFVAMPYFEANSQESETCNKVRNSVRSIFYDGKAEIHKIPENINISGILERTTHENHEEKINKIIELSDFIFSNHGVKATFEKESKHTHFYMHFYMDKENYEALMQKIIKKCEKHQKCHIIEMPLKECILVQATATATRKIIYSGVSIDVSKKLQNIKKCTSLVVHNMVGIGKIDYANAFEYIERNGLSEFDANLLKLRNCISK